MALRTRADVQRQSILDFLNKGGEATCRQICAHIDMARAPVARLLRDMKLLDEISIREQKEKHGLVPYYAALATVTKKDPNALPPTFGCPVYSHRVTDEDRPIQNQGGQGSLRARVFVGSCAEWI